MGFCNAIKHCATTLQIFNKILHKKTYKVFKNIIVFFPIINYQLSIVNYPLSIVNYNNTIVLVITSSPFTIRLYMYLPAASVPAFSVTWLLPLAALSANCCISVPLRLNITSTALSVLLGRLYLITVLWLNGLGTF